MRIKLYDTYNQAKELYAKPRLKWRFCKWKHSPCLPVWRRGNHINIYRRYDELKEIRGRFISTYEWSDVGKERHPILSKIFKKPFYTLPIWLSFFIFNFDLVWKTKWDEYRFEFPPQLSIVFFGWSLNFWLVPPECKYPDYINNAFTTADDYWESMLWYIDYKHKFPERNRKLSGQWRGDDGRYDKVRKEFFKEEYQKYMKCNDSSSR